MRYIGPCWLIQVNGQCLLEHQINSINQSISDCEIIVVIGFEYKKVIKHFINKYNNVRFIYNQLYEFNNIGLSIQLGLYNAIYPNILIIYGDLLFSKTYLNDVIGEKSKILFDATTLPIGINIGGIISQNRVTNLGYGLSPVLSQIFYITGNEKKIIIELANNEEMKKLFGHEIINLIIEQKGQFIPKICKEPLKKIYTTVDYNEVIK